MRSWSAVLLGVGVCLSLGVGSVQAEDAGHDLALLSRKVIQPMAVLSIQRHLDPVHLRRDSLWVGAMRGDRSSVAYWFTAQLPDGSMMQLPYEYDVTRLEDAVAKDGQHLSVYRIARSGSKAPGVTVGINPSDNLVVLSKGVGASPAPGVK